jgi:hypothetical protein
LARFSYKRIDVNQDFAKQVSDLVMRLRTILRTTAQLKQFAKDPEMQIDLKACELI